MNFKQVDEQVKKELIQAVPNQYLIQFSNNLAVKDPIDNSNILLTERCPFVPLSEYDYYSDIPSREQVKEKCIILDLELLGDRGKRALRSA